MLSECSAPLQLRSNAIFLVVGVFLVNYSAFFFNLSSQETVGLTIQ